jgi:transglutaminase-like putative cysteine protease
MNAPRLASVVALLVATLLGVAAADPARAEARVVWHRSVQIATDLQPDGLYSTVEIWEVTPETPSAARVAGQQSFGFSRALETATVLNAYVRKPDGTTIPVAPQAVLHQALSARVEYPSFSDWASRTIIFPDVEAGDTVHYEIRRTAKQALFPGQFENTLHLGPLPNLTRADISITAPAALALHVVADHLVEDPTVAADGQVIRSWHLDPDDSEDAGGVTLQASTFPDYAALGAAYAARALPQAEPDAAVRTLADQLTAGVTDPEEKARRIYAYVAQNIRYIGLQLGIGRVVPHPADEVIEVGYGDCKDHVALLGALLAAVGIASEPALITTESRYDLPAAPTLGILDHVILYVPQFDLFLDSTSPYAPFGVLPFGDYGKPVVLSGPEGGHLGRVPPLAPDVAVIRATTDATIEPDGSVSGDTETTAQGPSAITLREVASSIEDQGTSSAAENQLRRLGTPGEGGFSFQTPLALTDTYGLQGHFELDDKLADAPETHFSLPGGLTVLSRDGAFLVGDEPVDGDGHLCFAGHQSETIHLSLPDGASVASLPPDVSITGGFASYVATYSTEDGMISVHRRFSVTSPRPLCSADEYEAMRPVLQAARRDMRAQVTVARDMQVGAAQ